MNSTTHVNIYARSTIFPSPCRPQTTAIARLIVPTDFPLDTNHIFLVSGMSQFSVISFPHWRHVDPGMSQNQRRDISSLALRGFCTGQIRTNHVNIYACATEFPCPCRPRTTAIASLHVPTDFPLDTNDIFPVSGMTQFSV